MGRLALALALFLYVYYRKAFSEIVFVAFAFCETVE